MFRLKIFHDAAKHSSFTKSAELNFITQPAVTKNIKELEAELGISLFERKNARIMLTRAGEIYFQYIQHLFKIYNEAQFKVQELKQRFHGKLNIGASTTIGQYVLPEVLANFNKKYPNISIQMLNVNTEKIELELQNNSIDLGFTEGHSGKSILKYESLMNDEIVAVIHKNHPLFIEEEINIENLENQELVLRENGSGSLDIIFDYFRRNRINLKKIKIKAQLGSTESIKNFIKHSHSIAFLSIHSLGKDLLSQEFKILDIENFCIKRKFYAVYLHGNFDGIPRLFLDYFKSYHDIKKYISAKSC